MFGYSTDLRSATKGQAQFTMEFLTYKQLPQSIADDLIKKSTAPKKNVA
jgi:elongation factor G